MQNSSPLLTRIEEYLIALVPDSPASLYAPIRAAITNGGKRIRPLLTAFCGNFPQEETWLPPAAAIELLHTFTLVHDDIMDNAVTRRGRPAIHIAYGMNEAILAGDTLVALAMRALAGAPRAGELLGTFAEGFQAVCEGQALDKEFEEKDNVSMEEYLTMIELKTARIFECAAALGAISAGGANLDACREFAREIGIAFQLQDDLLDLTAGESFGKAIGGDILEGKRTILFVLGMTHTGTISDAQRALFERLRAHTTTESDIALARIAFEQMGILAETAQLAEHHSKLAEEQLAKIPNVAQRERLHAFSQQLLGRTI